MSKITRISQYTRFNVIDFAIVVIAICAPYIYSWAHLILQKSVFVVPPFEEGIIPKHIITISVLFLRIAIAKGQNPHTDNSISIIFLALWSTLWLLLSKELDQFFTRFLSPSIGFQITYWFVFVAITYFLLFELTFRKKKIVEAETQKNIFIKSTIDRQNEEIEQHANKLKKVINELEIKNQGIN